MTAVRQVERLGFAPGDVRHIVLTHLDFDHAGGLDDFPEAQVHLMALERDYAAQQKTWLDRQRFRPQQWSSRARWQVYSPEHGQDWFDFASVRALHALASQVIMVPLPGHTFGHTGVAVHDGARWLLLAGNAYFYHQERDLLRPWGTPGLRFYQTLMEKERRARLAN